MSLIYTAPSTSTSTSTSSSKRNSIYIGSKADAKDRSKLERWGITHILNVTPEKEAGIKAGVPNYFEKKQYYTYRRIAVYDNSTSDLLQYAPSAISFISSALHYGSILVHCQRGVSRSSTCVLFYLMNKVGMTFDDALSLVKRRRDVAEPISAFMKQLKCYEGECKSLGLIVEDEGSAAQAQAQAQASRSAMVDVDVDVDEAGKSVKGEKGNSDNTKKRKAGESKIIGPSRGPSQVKRVQGPSRRPCIGPTLPPSYKTNDDDENDKDSEEKR